MNRSLYKSFLLFALYFSISVSIALVCCYLYAKIFYNEILMFNHARAQRYFETNIEKNWGVRKEILKTASLLNQFLYKKSLVNFNVNLELPGVSRNYNEEEFKFKNIEFAGTEDEIIEKLRNAEAGTAIIIKPGEYTFKQRNLQIGQSGTEDNRIALMALEFGEVTFNFYSLEGIYVNKANWVIKNIKFNGVCELHSQCEHAIHLVPGGDSTYIYNNVFKNFNAHIKVNGAFSEALKKYVVVDDVKIVNNTFYNDSYRNVNNPVTPIDIVGGERHLIDNNIITDFSKNVRSLKTSWTYGAFIKGESSFGRIENNIVACSYKLPYQSALDARVGLSFGGGGTAHIYCPGGHCDYEHKNGVIKNNKLINCINDSSIYINNSIDIIYEGNYFLNSLGLQIN
jgi:hypothetical protein